MLESQLIIHCQECGCYQKKQVYTVQRKIAWLIHSFWLLLGKNGFKHIEESSSWLPNIIISLLLCEFYLRRMKLHFWYKFSILDPDLELIWVLPSPFFPKDFPWHLLQFLHVPSQIIKPFIFILNILCPSFSYTSCCWLLVSLLHAREYLSLYSYSLLTPKFTIGFFAVSLWFYSPKPRTLRKSEKQSRKGEISVPFLEQL